MKGRRRCDFEEIGPTDRDVVIDRAQNRVQVQSSQPREKLAAAIAEEGYAVAD